jgi:predicted nicotinamide N-methyase
VNDRADFLAAQTGIATAPLVPEIKLHLATQVTRLWEATEADLERTGLPPPYWAFAWPGGQALSRYVLDRPETVRGKRVLAFAAGGGIDAIASALCGAAKVTAAEIDAYACAAIGLNAALNGVAVDTVDRDLTAEPDHAWDVVLGGDVCYERPMSERAIPWLRGHAARGALVLLGDPGRAYLPATGLEELALYQVPTTLDLEDRTVRETRVLRLLP